MVGLGNTAKKIQTMIDAAEDLYAKMNELRQQVEDLRAKVDETSETVDRMDHQLDEQRAILAALAEDAGIDVDQVLADAAIERVEPDAEAGTGAETGGEAAPVEEGETTDAAGGSAAEPED